MSEYDDMKAQKDAIVKREKAQIAAEFGADISGKLMKVAHTHNQTVGEKNDYYVTLRQLEIIILHTLSDWKS